MLKISKRSEYALMTLQFMTSASPQTCFKVESVAEETGIPRGILAKVMQAMRRAKILRSCKGAGGGYVLEMVATEVEILDVLAVFDDQPDLVPCLHESESDGCQYRKGCKLRDPMAMLSRRIHESLSGMTVEQLFSPQQGDFHQVPIRGQ